MVSIARERIEKLLSKPKKEEIKHQRIDNLIQTALGIGEKHNIEIADR